MNKKELIDLIKNDESIKQYKRLEKIINSDELLLKELKELKDIQKELVNLQYLGKREMALIVEKQYDDKLKKINENPLLYNYLQLQDELNYLLQEIKMIIEKGLEITKKHGNMD